MSTATTHKIPSFSEALEEAALRAQAEHPRLKSRIARALVIAQTPDAVVALTDDLFEVQGSRGARYQVERHGGCTCPDSAQRGFSCKHRIACVLLSKVDALPSPEVPQIAFLAWAGIPT